MGDVASVIAVASNQGAVMRIGRVVSFDGRQITVNVGSGALVAMAYLVEYQPVLGDYAICLYQNSVWLCLGASAGSPPDNPLINPSFEGDTNGVAPAVWGKYHLPSSTTTSTMLARSNFVGNLVDGSMYLEIAASGTGVSSSDYVYSEAISVLPGQRWAADCWAQALFSVFNSTAQAGLFLTWYALATDVYPTTSAADTPIAVLPLSPYRQWRHLVATGASDGIVVPTATAYMRVTARSGIIPASGDSVSLYFDAFSARKVG